MGFIGDYDRIIKKWETLMEYCSRKIMGSSWSSGWWLSPTPLKNDGVKVSWDDCSIPKMMGKYM